MSKRCHSYDKKYNQMQNQPEADPNEDEYKYYEEEFGEKEYISKEKHLKKRFI